MVKLFEAEVRAEIGRRLRDHYKICSRTPDRFVLLIENIGQSNPVRDGFEM
jgi:hypothetical protein